MAGRKVRGKMLIEFIKMFFAQSSIHGFPHMSARKRHPIELIIWIVIVGAAIYGAVVLSSITLRRYTENPTVISMERDRFSWNTTFPAATICPTYKINEPLLELYVQSSTEKNKTLLREFLVTLAGATYTNFDTVVEYEGIAEENYLDILLDLQFEFKPAVSNSGGNDKMYTLQKIVSEMGICYSFNSKLAIYNSPDYWDEGNWDLVEGNETFYVNPLDGEVFANVMNMSTGFDIYVHGPYEVADIASKKLLHLMAISYKCLYLQRKCRFYDESNLKHSPAYSYVLCRMECRAALAKRLCGCVPHFYRKLEGEKICNVPGLHCLAKHKEKLILLKGECSCLPNCDEVNYIIEDMDTREWFLGSNLQWGLKEYPKMRLRRDIIFGFSDLLVYIGGMAGLFLGCSVLSFIEIVYFFTLRLYWFVIKYGKETRERF
ncbi:Pickpocket protein 11-like Protein [Tribolium castaneum]|uniref:Pickpocket protein 11-like Protein n=1 Tax=Tribolium castaneum TaxID=7070 RepID=D7EHU3_TRICA|nr:Pickpocket protein 11-like Protein [Tribolium castaneum]